MLPRYGRAPPGSRSVRTAARRGRVTYIGPQKEFLADATGGSSYGRSREKPMNNPMCSVPTFYTHFDEIQGNTVTARCWAPGSVHRQTVSSSRAVPRACFPPSRLWRRLVRTNPRKDRLFYDNIHVGGQREAEAALEAGGRGRPVPRGPVGRGNRHNMHFGPGTISWKGCFRCMIARTGDRDGVCHRR